MVVNSDTHAPDDLINEVTALGADMTEEEAERALRVTPYEAIRHIS